MAGGEAPRLDEHVQARPVARIVAAPGEEVGEAVARCASSSGARPTAWAPISEAAAWPSAQARTSWPSSATLPSSSSTTSTVTRLPQTGDCFVDARLRRIQPALVRDRRGEPQDVAIVEGGGHARDIGAPPASAKGSADRTRPAHPDPDPPDRAAAARGGGGVERVRVELAFAEHQAGDSGHAFGDDDHFPVSGSKRRIVPLPLSAM